MKSRHIFSFLTSGLLACLLSSQAMAAVSGVPFVCNQTGSADGFAGYVRQGGPELIGCLTTSSFGNSETGLWLFTGASVINFQSLVFDIQGNCDSYGGPFISVSYVTPNGDKEINTAACSDGTTIATLSNGYVRKLFTPTTLGLPAGTKLGTILITLEPEEGSNQVFLNNIKVNNAAILRNTFTRYNFCPLGFLTNGQ